MACELFAAKNRTFAGIMIENFWSIATCLFALLAFFIRDWVYLQLFISLFGLLTIPLFWYAALQSMSFVVLLLCFVHSSKVRKDYVQHSLTHSIRNISLFGAVVFNI